MAKEFITGNKAVVCAAINAGAEMMTGYPITPATEILEYWVEAAEKNPKLKALQTEDEMAAGFAMIGGVLAGKKAFTAAAGPGNVLMQDAFSMAENMRLPTVAFINQRGGPSTGTVIYSQQELNLTCFGGNGEGLRIVYSASTPQEMYDLAIKAFNAAWTYRFPTFVLSDGYLAKTSTEIDCYLPAEKDINLETAVPYLLGENHSTGSKNLRNTYNLEIELFETLVKHKIAFDAIRESVVEDEAFEIDDAEIIILAHGSVASSAILAAKELRKNGKKIGVYRPITLQPFPIESAKKAIQNKKVLFIESSLGQFERLVKSNLSVENYESLLRPALAITPEDIKVKLDEMLKEQNG